MHRLRPLGVALPLLITTLWTSAGAQNEMRGYLQAGLALPSDPPELPELWKLGWTAGGSLGLRTADDWEVLFSFHFHRFATDREEQIEEFLLVGPGGVVAQIADLKGGDFTMITLMGEIRYHFPTEGGTLPFLSFGAGYFSASTAETQVTPVIESIGVQTVEGRQDNALGVLVGTGLQWDFSNNLRLVLDTSYTIGFTEPVSTQFLPLRLGLSIR